MKKTLFFILTLLSGVSYANLKYTSDDRARLEKVEEFVNNSLTEGRSKKNLTPLIADGVNTVTKEPVVWLYPDGKVAPISNFANQQNFLKILNGLTVVTDNPKYNNEAKNITKYFFDNYVAPNGLFYWGGHRFVNLDTLKLEGPQDKNQVHELKNHFPYYEFLYSVDNNKTKNYIKSFWNAHIEDWETMDMGRHGGYKKALDEQVFLKPLPKDIVDRSKLPLMPQTKGLTFINAGSDLIFAAYTLDELNHEKGAKEWGKYLAKQYKLAANPKTGVPVYQFTSPIKREWPPKSDSDTNSKYGDRAQRQFGPEFGDIAQEGNALFKGNARGVIVENALIELDIAEKTNDKEMLKWAVDSLKNFYKTAFDMKSGEIKPIWTDGTDLSNYTLVRDGYYGKKGSILKPAKPAVEDYMLPLVKGYRLSNDQELWDVARVMGKNFDLGDIGDGKGKNVNLNLKTANSSPYSIFVLIELYRGTKNENYIQLARKIADNIVADRFKRGFFLEEPDNLNAKVDSLEALALVNLDAVLKGKEEKIAPYISKGGYIHGEHIKGDSVYDKDVIYKEKIDSKN